jgi:hypothetical protein
MSGKCKQITRLLGLLRFDPLYLNRGEKCTARYDPFYPNSFALDDVSDPIDVYRAIMLGTLKPTINNLARLVDPRAARCSLCDVGFFDDVDIPTWLKEERTKFLANKEVADTLADLQKNCFIGANCRDQVREMEEKTYSAADAECGDIFLKCEDWFEKHVSSKEHEAKWEGTHSTDGTELEEKQ